MGLVCHICVCARSENWLIVRSTLRGWLVWGFVRFPFGQARSKRSAAEIRMFGWLLMQPRHQKATTRGLHSDVRARISLGVCGVCDFPLHELVCVFCAINKFCAPSRLRHETLRPLRPFLGLRTVSNVQKYGDYALFITHTKVDMVGLSNREIITIT